MFNHHIHQNVSKRVIFHWFLLAFNGGAINAGGFLATGRFVSHVTGFYTLFGDHLTNKEIEAALGILSVPAFFLLGAFIAGLLVDRPQHFGRKPRYDWVMAMSSLCLFLAAGGGEFLLFGVFGESNFALKQSYLLLVLLCLASGLQNGAITSSSHHSVRSTHMTGTTTDLGLGLAKVFTFDLNKGPLKSEVRANIRRFGTIVSFAIGSAVGAWIFVKLGYRGFMMPALIAAYASWHGKNANGSYDRHLTAA